MSIDTNKAIVGGSALGIVGFFGYGLYKAIISKSSVNEIYRCFCNANSDFLANDSCQQALDKVYGGKGLSPYNVTLFCGPEGSLSPQQTNSNWAIGLNAVVLGSIFIIASIAIGILIYKKLYPEKPEEKEPFQFTWSPERNQDPSEFRAFLNFR